MVEKNTVLIVDDNKMNRENLRILLEDDFRILFAGNGQEALRTIEENNTEISAVYLDLIMPFLDGVEVVRRLNLSGYTARVPVLIAASENKKEYISEAISYGAFDVVPEPANNKWTKIKIKRAIDHFDYKKRFDFLVKEQVSEARREFRRRESRLETFRDFSFDLIRTLCSYLETGSGAAEEHIGNVCRITFDVMTTVCRKYPEHGLTDDDVILISCAAAVHDIGKGSLPETFPYRISGKSEDHCRHTERGWEIFSNMPEFSNRKFLKYCRDICRWHHERWNGKGYPDGLYRQEVPIWAQVVGFADAYDSLREGLSGSDPLAQKIAFDRIAGGEKGAFNPSVIECFRESRSGIMR